MPRPKKEALSPAVGTVKLGTKRGNPAFVSSSFYTPKQVNIRFDRALLTLKAAGYDLDRSDILSALMDRFATAVDSAEKHGGDLDLQEILASAADDSPRDLADVSVLKHQMRQAVEQVKTDSARQQKELEGQLQAVGDFQKSQEKLRVAMAKHQMEWMTRYGIDHAQQLEWMKEQGIDPAQLLQENCSLTGGTAAAGRGSRSGLR
jgi:hypothetical protein